MTTTALVRASEAAAILGITPRELRSLREAGRIDAEPTPGGQWKYRRADLETITEKQRRQTSGETAESGFPEQASTTLRIGKLVELRDGLRRYASLATITDRRWPEGHPILRSLQGLGEDDPYYWRWDTRTSDECFRLVMRRIDARLTRQSEYAELVRVVDQTVRDYIDDQLEERYSDDAEA